MTDPAVGVRQEPDAVIKQEIGTLSERSVCGQTFTVTWTHGPSKGMPVTVYCVEPLCIYDGKCSGQRFVPHVQQYTTSDTDDPRWGPRQISPAEAVQAVREVSKRARQKGAMPLLWDDRMIWEFIKKVWRATKAAVQGDGDERRGWVR